MNDARNEIRTGLLVLLSLAALVGILIYLGAPGVFTPQKGYVVYFDNAAGIKLGTPVMLAGRKVGQVVDIQSPVPVTQRPLGENGKPLPLEVRVSVKVSKEAQIYNVTKVTLASYGFLDEPVIDFTEGVEASGLAPDSTHFVGERPGGLADTGTQIIEKLDPAITQLITALKSLEDTANNLTRITSEGADLPVAFAEVRKVATNLAQITGPDGSLHRALSSFEGLVGPDGEISRSLADFRRLIAPDSDLSKALANVESFTKQLADTNEIPSILQNFKSASARLNVTLADVREDFDGIATNLEQASDTLKRQPWRLIWPSTKKYPEDQKPTPIPRARKVRR